MATASVTHNLGKEIPMNIAFEQFMPSAAQLRIDIQLAAPVNVTAFSARQKVTGFVADEISTNMHGGDPTLVIADRIYWRVPIILSLPPIGDRGTVGEINVDVETGQLQITPKNIAEIEQGAKNYGIKKSPGRPYQQLSHLQL
jgi:hypothetical protein